MKYPVGKYFNQACLHGKHINSCPTCNGCGRLGDNKGRGYANPRMACNVCGVENICNKCKINMKSQENYNANWE